ncbi:MAG: PilZ domain-containing protein [Deltaproteobacteria bacterium]|nr:PilZ domain-containing protein [Deltaproteobacteria bacterium]
MSASDDRRQTPRTRVDLLFNKYIDGYPHLCRTIDVSADGLLLERVSEPAVEREFYPVEIGLMDAKADVIERLWIWAQQVWCDGERQALRFVGLGDSDREKLDRLLARAAMIEAAAAV